MKIPPNVLDRDSAQRIMNLWINMADQISMEHGIFIQVAVLEWEHHPIPRHIVFMLGRHQFESLAALRRAINNKAFL